MPGSLKMFSFPLAKPEMVEKWLKSVNLEGFVPKKHNGVCSLHFHDKDYTMVSCSGITMQPSNGQTT